MGGRHPGHELCAGPGSLCERGLRSRVRRRPAATVVHRRPARGRLSTAPGGWPVGRGAGVGTLDGVKPMLHRAAGLRAAGYSDDDIRRLLRSGVLTPVRRGAYTDGSPDDRDAGHALLLQAALAELGPGAVASHVSAAVVHGLPTWGLPLERAHVTFDRRTGGRLDARLHVHTAPLHPDDIVVVDGLAVTSWARTVVDIARRARFEPAVAVADAALAARRTDPGSLPIVAVRAGGHGAVDSPALRAALDAAVRRAKGWPGVPAARRVVAFADGRAESVGESRSRIAIARAGLPPPVLQLPVALAGSDGVRGLRVACAAHPRRVRRQGQVRTAAEARTGAGRRRVRREAARGRIPGAGLGSRALGMVRPARLQIDGRTDPQPIPPVARPHKRRRARAQIRSCARARHPGCEP